MISHTKHPRYRVPDPKTEELLDRLAERRQSIKSFRARANKEQKFAERFSDKLIRSAGSMMFLFIHVILFSIWLAVNLIGIPGVKPWDPFPLGLLTMILTLEQSLLAIFIIISQNRASEIADLRNEIDLQINILAEEEVTKALSMLRLIGERLDIKEIVNDEELLAMTVRTDLKALEHQTEQELNSGGPVIYTASEWSAPE